MKPILGPWHFSKHPQSSDSRLDLFSDVIAIGWPLHIQAVSDGVYRILIMATWTVDTIAETTLLEVYIARQDRLRKRNLAGSELADKPLLLTYTEFDQAFNLNGALINFHKMVGRFHMQSRLEALLRHRRLSGSSMITS